MRLWNSSFKDYYRILQIHSESEGEVVTAAYYALMKKYHPDRPSGHDEYARLINEAYEVLSDPKKRQEYHEQFLEFSKFSELKECEDRASYLSKKNTLLEREAVLKAREEELEKKELALKLKIKLSAEFARYAENSEKNQQGFLLPELTKKFLDAAPKDLKEIGEEVRKLGREKILFIRECFKNKLSLEQEAFLCELMLEINDSEVYLMLEPAFKFRQFYPRLFKLMIDENLVAYRHKAALISKNLSYSAGNHQELLPLFLEIYRKFFSREENMEFLVKVQVLIENGKISGPYKNQILLAFLMSVKDFGLQDYFQTLFKKLDKEEKNNPSVQAVLSVCRG